MLDSPWYQIAPADRERDERVNHAVIQVGGSLLQLGPGSRHLFAFGRFAFIAGVTTGGFFSRSVRIEATAGTEWKPAGGVQGSIRVPPHDVLINPIGTPSCSCKYRPK